MPASDTMKTWSAREAAELAGVSYRTIDYATRKGAIEIAHPAEGSGTRRRLSIHDILVLRALGHISAAYDDLRGTVYDPWIPLLQELTAEQLLEPVELLITPRMLVRLDLTITPAERALRAALEG